MALGYLQLISKYFGGTFKMYWRIQRNIFQTWINIEHEARGSYWNTL